MAERTAYSYFSTNNMPSLKEQISSKIRSILIHHLSMLLAVRELWVLLKPCTIKTTVALSVTIQRNLWIGIKVNAVGREGAEFRLGLHLEASITSCIFRLIKHVN